MVRRKGGGLKTHEMPFHADFGVNAFVRFVMPSLLRYAASGWFCRTFHPHDVSIS